MSMKRKAIIFGTSLMAKRLHDNLKAENKINPVAFVVENDFITSDEFCDLPVYGFESIENIFDPSQYGIYVCIGYTRMNGHRKRIFENCLKKGYELLNYISPDAIIHAESMGRGNLIFGASVLSVGVQMGNGNIFIENASISHDTVIGDFNFFAPSATIAGEVTIGNNCFLGINCTIRNAVKIADYTLAGAASYVDSDTEAYGVYVPANTVKIDKSSLDVDL